MYMLIFAWYLNGDVHGDADVYPTLAAAQEQMREEYEDALSEEELDTDPDADINIDDRSAWVYASCEDKRVWYIKEAKM